MKAIATLSAVFVLTAGMAYADWGASPDSLGVPAGAAESRTLTCPAGGLTGALWGSGLYTSDSSVCSAAVHGGYITAAGGGQVSFAMRPGMPTYPGSTANGVTSSDYGAWGSSFQIVGAVPGVEAAAAIGIQWATTMIDLGSQIAEGQTLSVSCPASDGSTRTIWGTGIYTSDSAICIAAVHDGRISAGAGGTVTFRSVGAQESYSGSVKNGVTSQDYGSWNASFRFE